MGHRTTLVSYILQLDTGSVHDLVDGGRVKIVTDVDADLTRPEPDQEPTDELPPHLVEGDRDALDQLAAAGWGEGDHGDAGLPDGFWDDEEEPE